MATTVWGTPAVNAEPVLEEKKDIDVVHVDGLVVLKIMKHCKESMPEVVAGTLLGLDEENTLEVTSSFPLPAARATEDGIEDDVDGTEYQMEMMKLLREVNADNNCVGWYQSAHLGSFCTPSLIDTQFNYQESLGTNSVVLVYDPSCTSNGKLSLRAFRLTKDFMDAYRAKDFTKASLSSRKLRPSAILEELPVQIRNSHLINALLLDVKPSPLRTTTTTLTPTPTPGALGEEGVGAGAANESLKDCSADVLNLSTNPYLEKNMELLGGWTDDLTQEMGKFQHHSRSVVRQKQELAKWTARRENENKEREAKGLSALTDQPPASAKPLVEPSRLDALLMSRQIDTYCSQINEFTGQSLRKLFVADSFHKDQ